MRRILGEEFFQRDTKIVARELLGKFLVRKIGSKEISSMITETECYDGPLDLASHASRGRTKRTEVMFGRPACLYVYLCYGIHFMLNIITREEGYPAGVLIRGTKEASGPGRVTRYFEVDKKLHGRSCAKISGLWVEDRGVVVARGRVKRGPRVGVAYAGPVWSAKNLRFMLK